MDLNPRQTEWIADMRFYLQTWEKIVSPSSQLSSPVLLPRVEQKKSAPISNFGALTNNRRNQSDETPKKNPLLAITPSIDFIPVDPKNHSLDLSLAS